MRLVALSMLSMALACGRGEVVCGLNTHLVNDTCVGDGVVVCGAGTHAMNGQCVPDGGGVTCGAGTHAMNGMCLPDGELTCGAGTQLVGTQCVAIDGTRYELRIIDSVPADGVSKVPVFAVGIKSDGTAATDPMVLSLSPSFAGAVTPATFNLGAMGTTAYFVPCNALTSTACTGMVELSMALASAPSAPVATVMFKLVTPTGVGTPAPCLAGGNVLFFDGDPGNYIFTGMQTVTQGMWSSNASATYGAVHVTPSTSSQGLWWDAEFKAPSTSTALGIGVYEMAERYPFQAPGHPGFDVGGDGRGCNTVTGRFQIHAIETSGTMLTNFTATFEHHCEGGSSALRGCVHFGP